MSNPTDARRGRSFHDYVDCLRRRKLAFGIPVVGAVVIGTLLYLQAPSRYEAETVVALDVRKLRVLPADAVVTPLPQESPVLRTELDVISSRLMAERVLDRLARGALGDGMTGPEVSAGWWSGSDARATESAERRERVDQLLKGLKVSNDGRSYTIFISYSAADPKDAAAIANAFGEAYLEYQTAVQTTATRQAGEWLGRKVVELRKQVESAETVVETFRRGAGIVVSDGASLETRRLNAVNAELVQARTRRSEAQARLQTARALSQSPTGLDAFSTVLDSPIIQSLRTEQAKIERNLSELQDTGAFQSDQIPALQSQLGSLKQQIAVEVERVITSIENEIDVAERKEVALQAQFEVAQADLSTVNQSRVRLNQLTREAEANRSIYETYLNRYKQTIEQDGLATPEALLITRAEPPARPASPNPVAFLALSLLAGGGLGFAAAMIRENGDMRVRSLRALKDAVPIPVIGTLPQVAHETSGGAWALATLRSLMGAAMRGRRAGLPAGSPGSMAKQLRSITRFRTADFAPAPAELIATDPHAPFSEAVRKLRSTLQLSPATKNARLLMVTSATAGEGKTTLALALARSIALSGQTVVVVDADLRNPALAAHAAAPSKASVMDIIGRGDSLEDAITIDTASPAHLIVGGPAAAGADFLQNRLPFKALLAALRKRYDFVILDTGPVSLSVEATQIGDLVDATLFVVGWGKTTSEAVASATQHLALCGLSISGLVLNHVAGHRHTQYASRTRGIGTPTGRGDGPAPRPRLVHDRAP